MQDAVPVVLVEDDATFLDVVASLADQPVLGLDTESDSFHHYQEKVCLLQVSDPDRDIVIDPLRIRDLTPLKPLLEDPRIVKVVHGADYDVVCLKRDYGFHLHGIFDTMLAARFLDMPAVGLGDVINEVFGVALDKGLQRHDWAARPLLPAHLEYATGDTHWLIALREVLVRRLTSTGWLDAVNEECACLEAREWGGRRDEDLDFLRVRGAGQLSVEGQRVLREVVAYRDAEGRRMDRPVFKVIPDPILLRLAQEIPRTDEAFTAIVRPRTPLHRAHGRGLMEAVQRGLQNQEPLPEAAPRVREPQRGNRYSPVLSEHVRRWRAQRMEVDRIPASHLISNALIREISRAVPVTMEELAAVPDIRQWQVRLYGEEILALVEQAMDEVDGIASRSRKKRRTRRAE